VRREVRKLNITQQIKDLRDLYDAQDPDMADLTVQDGNLSMDQEEVDALIKQVADLPQPLAIKEEVMSDLDQTLTSESEST
jgi:hypothetical protein